MKVCGILNSFSSNARKSFLCLVYLTTESRFLGQRPCPRSPPTLPNSPLEKSWSRELEESQAVVFQQERGSQYILHLVPPLRASQHGVRRSNFFLIFPTIASFSIPQIHFGQLLCDPDRTETPQYQKNKTRKTVQNKK